MTEDKKREKEEARVHKRIKQLTVAYTLSPPASMQDAISHIAQWQTLAELGLKTLITWRKEIKK